MKNRTNVNYTIQLAVESDLNEIMELYRLAVGSEGCTWSEEYPNEEILRNDFFRNALFCCKNCVLMQGCNLKIEEKLYSLEKNGGDMRK